MLRFHLQGDETIEYTYGTTVCDFVFCLLPHEPEMLEDQVLEDGRMGEETDGI